MEFNINKGATLNVLKMELIQDGRNDYEKFSQQIQNANIYFSMTDSVTGVKKIGLKPATLSLVTPESCFGDQYYLTYQFTANDTSKAGRYIGQFTIQFLDGSGTLIVPIAELLYINVLDGGIK
jgi:hypothetical protein